MSKQLIAFSEENTAANVSAEDMFIRMNFVVLEAAIDKETTANGTHEARSKERSLLPSAKFSHHRYGTPSGYRR